MRNAFFGSLSRSHSWLPRAFRKSEARPHRDRGRWRPRLEWLEDRLAPATVSQTGSVLTISMDHANENLAIVSAGAVYTVTAASGFTVVGTPSNFTAVGPTGTITNNGTLSEVDLLDQAGASADSVTFNPSGTNTYNQLFKINLTHDATGFAVTFSGASHFNSGLQVMLATGGITAFAGAVLGEAGNNLSLTAAGALALSNLAITAGRTMLASTGTAANDNVTGDNAGNAFTGSSANPVSLAVNATTANNITLVNSKPLFLGNVTLGGGTLTVTARGDIKEVIAATGGIKTGAGSSSTFTVGTVAGSTIDLLTAPNNFAGSATFSQSAGGTVFTAALRDINAQAVPPNISALTSLQNLTLEFDNNQLVIPQLPVANLPGSLIITAGGPITQAAALSMSGAASFTVLGNFGITLTNAANNLTGPVSLNNPGGDATGAAAARLINSGSIHLATSNLGLSTFTVEALSGNITENGAVTQKLGSAGQSTGMLTFKADTGAQVRLDQLNDFEAPVAIMGASVNTVSLTNTSPLAAFPQTLPPGLTNLTLNFTNAPVVLPSLTLTGLTVSADGIVQVGGSSPGILTIMGTANFNAHDFPLLLSNNNKLNTVSVNNSGPNDVSVTNTQALNFSTSHVGSGSLTVRINDASGNSQILNTGAGIIQAGNAGPALFNAGNNRINLANVANSFTGPVELITQTGKNASVANGGTLTLGTSQVGGSFTATSTNSDIVEAPGATLNVQANTMLTALANITANNQANNFTLTLNTSAAGNVLVRNSGPVQLGTCSVARNLTVNAGGDITQATGTTVTDNGTATFNAGTNAVALGNANTFNVVALTSTGSTPVTLQDAANLTLGQVQLGGEPLNVTAPNVSENGAISQTGPGKLTLSVAGNVLLTGANNNIQGQIDVNAAGVQVNNRGAITFTGTSNMTGAVDLSAGNTLTLPMGALTVTSFSSSANLTIVNNDVTANPGGISFTGAVSLPGFVTLDTSGGGGAIMFNGDVNPAIPGTITLALPNGGSLAFTRGHWLQASDALAITGSNVTFTVGGDSDHAAILEMGGASNTLTMGTTSTLTIASNGTLRVGDDSTAETLTVNTGGGNLIFDAGSRLEVGLGTGAPNTTDKLVLAGGGNVQVSPAARLIGNGVANFNPNVSTTILDVGTSQILDDLGRPGGRFALTVDGSGNAQAFLMGADIVAPTYTPDTLSVASVTASGNGSVSGFQADGDMFTVTSSGGAASGLVAISDVNGNLDVVVRNAPATEILTLTTTANGGDGFTNVGGLAVDGPATSAVTISAATANVLGDITVAGKLAALTIRDMKGGAMAGGLNITADTATSSSVPPSVAGATTTITGRVLDSVHISLDTILSSLSVTELSKVLSTDSQSSLLAERFGTIAASGNAGASIAGDLNTDLTNANTLSSALPAVSLATVAGDLSGTWDVSGSVGTVTAPRTDHWNLGTGGLIFAIGANFRNVDKLTNVTGLSVGVVGSRFGILATGTVAGLTATSVNSGILEAGTFSSVRTTGNAALGDVGNFNGVFLTATTTLAALAVAGNALNDVLTVQNGNVNSILVGRDLSSTSITATATASSGAIALLTVGSWGASGATSVDAKSIGTLSAIGNVPAQIFGDFLAGTVTLHGTPNATSATLGALSASRNVFGMTFQIDNGSVGSFTVARQLAGGSITASSAVAGTIGAIQAGQWQSFNVTALSIGTLRVTGAALTGPSSPALNGDLVTSNINLFRPLASGLVVIPALASLAVAGQLNLASGNFIAALSPITSFSVGRAVLGTASLGALVRANSIGILTVGQWNGPDLEAGSLGVASITGFTLTEGNTPNTVSGDLAGGSTWSVQRGTTAAVASLSVAGGINSGALLDAPVGIPILTVAGQVNNATIAVDNPFGNGGGRIGALTIGDATGMTLLATTIGSLRTTGNTALNLPGSITASQIAVSGSTGLASAPVGIGSLSVVGSLGTTSLDAPAGITVFSVSRDVSSSHLAAGFEANGKLTTVTMGQLNNTDVTSQSVGTWSVVGNAALGLPGSFSGSAAGGVVTLTGNSGGVDLASFMASGAVTDAAFDIFGGTVTSFTVGRFINSNLLVGVHMPRQGDLAVAVATAVTPPTPSWNAALQTKVGIGTFRTTATLFDPADPVDSAAFQGSEIVSAMLGMVSLSGVNPTVPALSVALTFGVGFRAASGASAKGTVTANFTGTVTTLTPSATQRGQFLYDGLAG
jgi:hypothetical protein